MNRNDTPKRLGGLLHHSTVDANGSRNHVASRVLRAVPLQRLQQDERKHDIDPKQRSGPLLNSTSSAPHAAGCAISSCDPLCDFRSAAANLV